MGYLRDIAESDHLWLVFFEEDLDLVREHLKEFKNDLADEAFEAVRDLGFVLACLLEHLGGVLDAVEHELGAGIIVFESIEQ